MAEARPPRDRARRRGAWRSATWSAALGSALALAWPGEALAEPRDDRPWGRGVMRPTFGLSPWGLFNQDIASLSFGLGFNYFIINGLSVGLGLSDTIFIYRSAFKARYPGVEDQLPTNMLDVTPTLQYVFFRNRRFSPYVYGGVGPVFFNHGAGTYGQWVAGPGAYFNVAGPLFVSVGVGFSGLFPTGRCNDALTYQPADPLAPGVMLDLCSFRWGPQVGVTLAFGGGKRSRREPRPERREPPPPYTPVSNPLDEAVDPPPPTDAAEPAPEPEPEPEPAMVEPEPTEASPGGPASTDVPPSPAEGGPAAEPTEGSPPSASEGPSDATAEPAEPAEPE